VKITQSFRELIRKLFKFPLDVSAPVTKPVLPSYFYTVDAEDYRKTIEELKRQLEATRLAKEAATLAAIQPMFSGDELRKLDYIRKILKTLKPLLDDLDL